MTPQQILLLTIGLIILFIVIFSIGRKPFRDPSRLKMRTEPSDIEVASQKPTTTAYFNYNGHSWDGYEVLGVHGGSSISEIREAFERSVRANDKSSQEFFKTALETVLKDMKERGYQPKQ